MKIGSKEFATTGHTYVCGILNVTPDSFSDGGKWNQMDDSLRHVEEMLAQGMDLLDIGGESTRPGYTLLSDAEEIARVVPVIEAIKTRFDVPISLDTYKPAVAKAGLGAGADLINDIWGLRSPLDPDERMAALIAESGVPYCLMHNRQAPDYETFLPDFQADLRQSLAIAAKAGIKNEQIILDPGVGFGKTYAHNLEILHHLDAITSFGYPVLLGTSRKSVIGLTLDLPVNQREEGTLVTTVLAVLAGCMFVRVHDVEKNVRAIRMTEAILHG